MNACTLRAVDLEAGGGAVAAVAAQVLGAGAQPAEQVEGLDAAPRPPARLTVERDHHDRPPVALDQPRGDDPDHPGMPVLAAQHVAGALARGRRSAPRPRSVMRLSTWRRSELARSSSSAISLRAPGVLGQDQLEPRVGSVQAPRRVQARGEREGDGALVDLAGVHPRDRHQRTQPGLGRARQRAQPAADERAVLAHQRHDVGDRRQRHEVEVVLELAILAAAGGEQQRLRELVGDRGRAQLRAGVAAQRGVHDRGIAAARRQRAARGGR